jgi:lipopolysaccharide transport system ATP-binding protein
MSDVILKVENVSKLYRLGTVGTGTFGGDLQRYWKTKILGQEDPFLKIGQTNDRTSKEKAEFVWALQNINFEVKRGEILGIIGKNGAGKSTLLKLLSRITSPTTGSIKSAGRLASLLEVGTGFHPELTGRENIFLNGAILGMTKKEIKSKFDEIVDFSGCELYIDTPTKRYSSGMTVRLGFAVAAFLDPEILVVDEVLAVGDAEFQKRALGKMQEISKGQGRTILFVSHNIGSVSSLCTRGLLMNNGAIEQIGEIKGVIRKYLNENENKKDIRLCERHGEGGIRFTKTYILDEYGEITTELLAGKAYSIIAEYASCSDEVRLSNLHFAIKINTQDDISIADLSPSFNNPKPEQFNSGMIRCNIPKLPLGQNKYKYNLLVSRNQILMDWVKDANYFNVTNGDYYLTGRVNDPGSLFFVEHSWENN